MASKIGKVGWIDMRIANIVLEMSNASLSFSGGHMSPPPTPSWSLTSSYSTRGEAGSSLESAPACHLYHSC